jgi:PAS domain S-box-containing protein
MSTAELAALREEAAQLRRELHEAQDTIRAIQEGRVDAFVVGRNAPDRVYTLESADGPYRILVERMQQCAVTVAADSTVLYANCQSSSLLGRGPSELVGRPFRDLVTEVDQPRFDAIIHGDVEAQQGELRLQRADGTLVPVYLSAGALSAEEGGVCVLITDLTRQKQHEELIAAENLARSMLQQAADAVVVCDPDGKVAFASPAVQELCRGNPLGHAFSELFTLRFANGSPASGDGHFALETLGDEPIRGLETTLERPDTQPVSLLLSAGRVKDSSGEPLGSVVTLTDISALKRAEQELRDADRQKDEFLAVLAHELRNPLAPIVTGLDVIGLAGDTGETSAGTLRMMKRQVGQLSRLVDDLLEISRITLGKIDLRKEVVDFADVLASAMDSTVPVVSESNCSVGIDVPQEPVHLYADGARIAQVISNLLNNALKYTPQGGEIALTARLQGDELVVSVRDNGRGIEPEAIDEVFTMFAQPRGSSSSHDGLGVGLALVRSIVEMHGGSVSAASEGLGKGSEFTVRLPLGEATSEAPSAHSEPLEEHSRRRRVLVVDDNKDSANSLGMLLDLMDYEVAVAFDGETALKKLEQFRPQAVFLDLDMPRMDGYEVARQMRRREGGAEPVLIALTGWGQESDRQRTLEAGFDHHLLKPVDSDTLNTLLVGTA